MAQHTSIEVKSSVEVYNSVTRRRSLLTLFSATDRPFITAGGHLTFHYTVGRAENPFWYTCLPALGGATRDLNKAGEWKVGANNAVVCNLCCSPTFLKTTLSKILFCRRGHYKVLIKVQAFIINTHRFNLIVVNCGTIWIAVRILHWTKKRVFNLFTFFLLVKVLWSERQNNVSVAKVSRWQSSKVTHPPPASLDLLYLGHENRAKSWKHQILPLRFCSLLPHLKSLP